MIAGGENIVDLTVFQIFSSLKIIKHIGTVFMIKIFYFTKYITNNYVV